MLLRVSSSFPEQRKINLVSECLKKGGVIIYPTDTVYGFGCDIRNHEAIEKICRLKGMDAQKSNFSFICHDLSHLSDFCKQIDTPVYKMMKRNLPGPFTFILQANNRVPRMFKNKRKTVGIRVPKNLIAKQIVLTIANPILSSTVHDDDDILEYATDPGKIHNKYKNIVDIVIDGGPGGNQPSTVVDCTGDSCIVVRQGKGILL
ncbi:MAG: threonylcarbamoyl-AMP synthase [Bacteroidetes bacterium]|nr:threonylcarbamoyl-AMP synthase [Bacteroidota bacterium]